MSNSQPSTSQIPNGTGQPQLPSIPVPPATIAQLQSIERKATALEDALSSLQQTIHYGGLPAMATYPELLSKYSVLVSHTENLATSLAAANLRGMVIHPRVVPEDQSAFESAANNYLNRAQNLSVYAQENAAVRRLAEHMRTGQGVLDLKPAHNDVQAECAEIRDAHDSLVTRATLAVELLKEKYEWKSRVEVAEEEPENIEWSPPQTTNDDVEMGLGSSSSEADDDEVNENLGNGVHTPDTT